MTWKNGAGIDNAVTRRDFFALGGAAGISLLTGSRGSLPDGKATAAWEGRPDAVVAAAPRVSFLADRPYIDKTGREDPYRPPRGLRAGVLPQERFTYPFRWELNVS